MLSACRFVDLVMLQQNTGVPRVFGCDKIDILQNFERAQSDVAQISDWRRDYIEHQSSGLAHFYVSRFIQLLAILDCVFKQEQAMRFFLQALAIRRK